MNRELMIRIIEQYAQMLEDSSTLPIDDLAFDYYRSALTNYETIEELKQAFNKFIADVEIIVKVINDEIENNPEIRDSAIIMI